jgi:hypothetical protein
MSHWSSWPQLLNFTCPPATNAVKELIGNRALKHVLVVPPISDRQRGDVEAYANERNVELLEWPQPIKEMISLIDVQRNARNQTDRVLRILLKYDFLNPPVGPCVASHRAPETPPTRAAAAPGCPNTLAHKWLNTVDETGFRDKLLRSSGLGNAPPG